MKKYEKCSFCDICGIYTNLKSLNDGNPAIDGKVCNYCKKYVIYAKDSNFGKMSKKSKSLVKQEFERTGFHINPQILIYEVFFDFGGKDENNE